MVKQAYMIFGTVGKYRYSQSGNIKTKKTAIKILNQYKKIPATKAKIYKNFRIKKVRMKKWETYAKH